MPQKKKRVTLQIFYEEFQKRMDDVGGRLGGLEDRMGPLESSQRAVLAELATNSARLSALEATSGRLGARLDALHNLCEGLDKRFERLEDEYHAITAGLKRLEVSFDQFEADSLTERVTLLERKVDALERERN